MRNRRLLAVLCGAALFGGNHAIAQVAGQSDTPPTNLFMAAGPAGTVQYTFAAAVAKVVSDNGPSQLVVGPYGGSSTFLHAVGTGEVNFGIATALDFAMVYRGPDKLKIGGRNPYPHAPDLRLVGSGADLTVGLLVTKASGIKTVHDLKGRKVAGEYPAHLGAYVNTYAQLRNANLSWSDVVVVPVPGLTQGVEALNAGRVEVANIGVGAPQAREMDAKIGIRHVANDCSPAAMKRVTDEVPGYHFVTLKPGNTPGIPEEMCLTAWPVGIVTSVKQPNAAVTAMLKPLYENAAKLGDIHPGLKVWTQQAFVRPDATVPYHPAAIAYYKSVGAWTPDMDAVQEKLIALGK
jgi:TRAP transporter TAXI family solute receptor